MVPSDGNLSTSFVRLQTTLNLKVSSTISRSSVTSFGYSVRLLRFIRLFRAPAYIVQFACFVVQFASFRCLVRLPSSLAQFSQFAYLVRWLVTPFGYSNRVGRWPSTSPPKKMQISHLSDVFLLIFQLMKPVKAVNPSDNSCRRSFWGFRLESFECTGYGTSYGAPDSFGKTLAVQSDGTQDSCRIEDGLQLTGLHLEATWPHPFVALLCVADCLNKTQVKMKTLI